ncbi:SAM-dependent methyltransferase [Acidovorax sp. HMWF029]|uniref:SAM-dependent methyltransferase n=1 Tax=Acidovorax sp. HMWF029 TaxID=2056863 RepID=UPI000D397EF6|nr:SAM-dependent methyltransferase [Acidovorax sp. HMWF029]PTT21664.1 SAM-dependent methyltransferase [Acidovorax sp. HMWF029]
MASSTTTAADAVLRYPGGKNGAGVYQTIISAIPRHHTYVEPFAGSAAIARRIAPADTTILIERDPAMVATLQTALPAATVIAGDAVPVLMNLASGDGLDGWFFYLDPPYLHSTRKDLSLYKFELDDAAHLHLVASVLPALSAAGARWALSGYRSAMYDEAAASSGWHRLDFTAMTRRGPATESLWTNYEPSTIVPHDLRYIGGSFRERERIKRKASRWVAKILAMPDLERQFILASLAGADGGIPSPAEAMQA